MSMFDTLVLQKVKVQASAMLTHEAIEDMHFESYTNPIADALVMRLTRHVLAVGEEKHSYPADWWEAFRSRWFPAWWINRYPIQFNTFTTWRGVCPHHSVPGRGKEVHIAWLRDFSEHFEGSL